MVANDFGAKRDEMVWVEDMNVDLHTTSQESVPNSTEALFTLVYGELRKLAAAKLASEPPGQTLQATALVHDAFIRLVEGNVGQRWDSRGHFFAAAAEAMRRILVENARRKGACKRGGGIQRVAFDEDAVANPTANPDVIRLSDALDRLTAEAPVKAELVKLRCFAGLSHQEAAEALGISRATADRYWAYAKAWLYCEIYEADGLPRP